MIPKNQYIETEDMFDEPFSQSFLIDFDEERAGGLVDGLEAVRQSIFCLLHTERYEHLIYSWDYGVEFADLIGMETDLALPEIERRITEAVLQDSRVVDVDDFAFEEERGRVLCQFRVATVFGDLDMEQEVEL